MKKLSNTFVFIICATLFLFSQTSQIFGQWVQTNGLDDDTVNCIIVSPSVNEAGETNLVAGTNNGINLSSDQGRDWTKVLDSVLAKSFAQYTDSSGIIYLFAGTYNGIFLSTNSGTSWRLVLPTVFGWSFAVCPNDSNGTNVIAGTFGNGIYLSTDNGNSWKVVSVDMMGRFIFAMASMPSASGRTNVFAYAVMNAIDQGIYYSTNDGESWNDENPSYHMPIFLSTAVSINKSNSGLVSTNIYAVTYWGVDISTDLDSTWAYKGLRNYTINTLTVVNPDSSKSDMNHLTAGTNEGVFISLDNGDTIWAPFNQGLTNINIAALASDGTYLYAGTTGSGVWKRPLSEIITSVNDKQNDIPKRFTLMQNYPNPFNPSTIINYQLPMNNFVTLKVYDVLGREIKTLVNEYQSAGTHSIAFNATGLPSGVYLYRISAGNYSDTKKLVLIK